MGLLSPEGWFLNGYCYDFVKLPWLNLRQILMFEFKSTVGVCRENCKNTYRYPLVGPLFRLWLITIAARNQKFQLWCLNQFVENRTLALTFSEYRASKLRLNKWEIISAHSNLESLQKPFSTTNFSWVSAEPSAHSSCFQTPRELTQPICIHILDAKLNFDFYCFSSAYYSLYCSSVSSAWFHHYLTNL